MGRIQGVWISLAIVLLTLLAVPPDRALAQDEGVPREFRKVRMEEKLGTFLPMKTTFRDEKGKPVALADLFDGEKPVILTLVYFRCPMLCGLVLNGLVDGLKEMGWTAGDEFRIVTISFDPLETPTLARGKKQNMMQEYGRPQAASGWRFLTGTKASIEVVTGAVGFHYEWSEEQNQYLHPLGIFICSPNGQVTHFRDGIVFPGDELKTCLTEAADGKIGSWIDRFGWVCGHLLDADNPGIFLMKLCGILVLVALVVFILIVRRSSKRKGKVQAPAAA